MTTNGPDAEESSGTDHRPIADGGTQTILVASDDGEIFEPTAGEDDGEDCDCHLLPGDYLCALPHQRGRRVARRDRRLTTMTMNYHNDDRRTHGVNDIDPDADALDTDYETIREAIDGAEPGEPFPIDVALELTDHSARGDLPGRPADYDPEHDTPDEAIAEAHELAEPGDWIAVTVEFPARTLERIQRKHGVVAEWIRTAVRIRFQQINYDLEAEPKVTVEVSTEVAERAQLTALHYVAGDPEKDYHTVLREILLNMVQPQTEYRVGGEPIASFDEDTDVVDLRDYRD